MKTKIMRLLGLMTATALLGGCVTMQAKVTPEEFGKDKTYALVSIISSKKLINYSANQSSSLSGLVKAVGKKRGFTESSSHSLDASIIKIRKQFSDSTAFTLMSEKKMMRNVAFKKLPSGELKTKFGIIPITTVSAKGYANLTANKGEAIDIGKLAKSMGVDGVIVMHIDYGYGFSGLNLFGLVSAGKHKAIINVSVTAFNRQGEAVWQETVRQRSGKGIPTIGESVNFEKLRPLLLRTTEQAIVNLMNNLETKLIAI